MNDISIEKMSLTSLPQVKEICDLSFSLPWSLDALKKELENTNAVYIIVKLGNTVVAFGGIWIVFDEASIINLAVHPNYRGNSFGDIIVENLIEEAKNRKATAMTLEVRVSNVPAINLYKKHGFIIEGTRKNFYDNPKEDGHIMWLRNIITNG